MSQSLREWAESKRYRVKRGDGNPIGGAPYGPDPGEDYVPLRLGRDGGRGFLTDATGEDGVLLLLANLFPKRPSILHRKVKQIQGVRASCSEEDVAIYVAPDAWTDALEHLLRPARRRFLSPEAGAKLREIGAVSRFRPKLPPEAPEVSF